METILVGLDTSSRAPEVLATAQTLAERLDARLILFRAVRVPVEVPVEAYTMSPGDLADHLRMRAIEELSAIAANIPSKLRPDVAVSVGVPWQAICVAAETHKADLIVIGSHGFSAVDYILGTTAAKVVNHAVQSVLVVRAGSKLSDPPS